MSIYKISKTLSHLVTFITVKKTKKNILKQSYSCLHSSQESTDDALHNRGGARRVALASPGT